MTPQELEAFDKADQMVHPVEDQWHYKILHKYGFVPQEQQAKGFVRWYRYEHPAGHKITCNTGVSADYWSHAEHPDGHGYWSSLEPYVSALPGVHIMVHLNDNQKRELEELISKELGGKDVDIEHIEVAGDGYHYKASYLAGSPFAVRGTIHFKATISDSGVSDFRRV